MTKESQVLDFIKNIIEEVKDFEGEITYATTLEELELDSLDYVQTQIETKKTFGVTLDNQLFISGEIKTLGELCTYIAKTAAASEETVVAN